MTGFWKAFAYCQDDETKAIYLHGNGRKLADMDVDCDGREKCDGSDDWQGWTAYRDKVQEYSKVIGHYVSDLDANNIPYVVFGNYGKKEGYTTFHPREYGIQPLSVMAVVCGDTLVSLHDDRRFEADRSRCTVYGVIRMVMMGKAIRS